MFSWKLENKICKMAAFSLPDGYSFRVGGHAVNVEGIRSINEHKRGEVANERNRIIEAGHSSFRPCPGIQRIEEYCVRPL